MDILEAAQHWPNYARTACNYCGEHWPCAPWREALKERVMAALPKEHPFVHAEHCASCAVNRPWRV